MDPKEWEAVQALCNEFRHELDRQGTVNLMDTKKIGRAALLMLLHEALDLPPEMFA
jgi:hypothetical protein